jgi:hypothetical protein
MLESSVLGIKIFSLNCSSQELDQAQVDDERIPGSGERRGTKTSQTYWVRCGARCRD